MSEKNKLKSELILEVAELKQRIKELESNQPGDLIPETVSNLAELIENSPGHITILAPDLTIQYINYPSPGLSKEDLIGTSITAFLEEEQLEEVESILQGVISTGRAALYETVFQEPGENGETHYYETHAVPKLNAGKITGLILYSRESTIRKKIAIEVKEQRDKIQSIFRSAPIGIGMVSNRILQQANDFLCEMIGYSHEELVNQDARIFYPSQEEYDHVGEEKYRQINLMRAGTVETRFKRKNGEIIDVLLSSSPVDSEDLMSGVTFSVLDITKRKQAEKVLMTATNDLRLRTKELNSLLKSSQALSSSLEKTEILQIISDSATDLLQIDSAAVYLLNGEDLYLGATTPPLDPEMPQSFRQAILSDHPHISEAVSTRQPVILVDTQTAELTKEERFISETRGLRTILYLPVVVSDKVFGVLILGTTGHPQQYSDADINLCKTLTNQIAISLQNSRLHEESLQYSSELEKQISERKQIEQTLIENEQNFRDLVENLKDGVAIAGENGFHLFVNSKFSEITGYSKAELLKMTGWDLSRKEDQGKYEGKMRARMSGKSIQPVYERIIMKKDGTDIPVEMSTTTTIWQGEKSPMAIIRDITERKRAEMDKDILLRQVQEANERLKSLSRELINSQEAERQRISQELHDEFGQALTAISLDLGIIERELTPDCPADIKKRVGDTRGMADELDQMIGELALDLRPSLLDDLGLMPTLNWYIERFSQRAEIKVNIEVVGSEKRLPSEIETALYRIVQEALTNVAKHSGAEEVILRINMQPKNITMSIEDDGEGFDLAELQSAHVPFRGLGLIGMGDRTALIGGHLDIQSRPGEGTLIEVKIPMQ